jgi:hypothetical protein
MSSVKARQTAKELFGENADDVLKHRDKIKDLFDAQQSALSEARKAGEQRDKVSSEMSRRAQEEMSRFITENWDKANSEAKEDPHHGKNFVPVEGDEEINQRLAKGYELVDRAFSENPANPNLKSEERSAIIRRHAAVRNRAAAYGRLVLERNRLEGKVSDLTKELEQFKSSAPAIAGSSAGSESTAMPSAWNSVIESLRKRAVART